MNSTKCKDAPTCERPIAWRHCRTNIAAISRRILWLLCFSATFIAPICSAALAVGAEPISTKPRTSVATSAAPNQLNSADRPKIQWRPARTSSPNGSYEKAPPVRTVRYEEDVFEDGPALVGKAALAAAPLQAGQNQPSTPLVTPFDEPTSPTPAPLTPPATEPSVPETRPMETVPPLESLRPPMETQPPLQFRDPSATEPEATRRPAVPDRTLPERTVPGRDPFDRPNVLETPATPDVNRELPSTQFPSYEQMRRNRPVHNPADDCEVAYSRLKENTIDKLSIDIKVPGERGNDIPFECTIGNNPFDPRCWKMTTYTWKASCLCHKPIYFEEEALERYGHSHGPGCEYLVSFAHFFGNVILLPYHMGVETPTECVYTLGVYRAGSCAPYIIDPFPISLRGAAFGAVGYCGTVALFP